MEHHNYLLAQPPHRFRNVLFALILVISLSVSNTLISLLPPLTEAFYLELVEGNCALKY